VFAVESVLSIDLIAISEELLSTVLRSELQRACVNNGNHV